MEIDLQDVLIFFHVLLFGYWLGADLGVFYCDSQLTRDDLSLKERLRVREIRRIVDMAPRTCVALILPIGFMLSVQYGSPIAVARAAIFAASASRPVFRRSAA